MHISKYTQTLLIATPVVLSLITIGLGWILPESLHWIPIITGACFLLGTIILVLALPVLIRQHLRTTQSLKYYTLFRGLLFLLAFLGFALTFSLLLAEWIEIAILAPGNYLDILLPVVLLEHVVSVLYFVFIIGLVFALVVRKEYREYTFSWLDVLLIILLLLLTSEHVHQLMTPHPFFYEEYGI